MRSREVLLLRGMRWRLGLSLLTVLTATIAVATAVLGPMYLHTAGDSVLRRTVDAAAPQTRGVSLTPYYAPTNPLAVAVGAQRTVQRVRDGARLFGAPITTALTSVAVPIAGEPAKGTFLLSRTGICAHLHFLQGRCDLGPDDVVLTARDARVFGTAFGRELPLSVGHSATTDDLRVAGIVATPNLSAPYWWGDGIVYFPGGQPAGAGDRTPVDLLITSQATVLTLGANNVPSVTVQLPVRSGSVDLADEAMVRRDLVGATSALQNERLNLTSGLPTLLDNADHQRHVMTTIVAIAAAQLVLLAVWVLASLLVRSGDARRSEARVARLRGFPGASMMWVTAAEPGLLCLIGVVLGVALAWLTILLTRSRLFVAGSSVSFDLWTVGALALTIVAIGGALGFGTWRLLRSADLTEGATRRPRGASTLSLLADAVLVVLAVVALVVLSTSGALGGTDDPLASAAPGLIAIGAAVIAVQLILLLCRLGVSFSAGTRWVAPFLALRQTARRPGVLRQSRVLIIALALACFAAAAWSVARANRESVSRFEIGSHTVVNVAPVSPEALQAAVDHVDPHGRFAMAVADLETSNTALVAVDASRLAAVAAWPRGITHGSVAAVQRAIAPPDAPTIVAPEQTLQVNARVSDAGLTGVPLRDLELEAWVFNFRTGSGIVPLGALHTGTGVYRGSLTAICPGGCRVSGLGVLSAPHAPTPSGGGVSLDVTGLSTVAGASVRPLPDDLIAGGWRANAGGVSASVARATGLSMAVSANAVVTDANATGAFSPPMVAVADTPRVLPAVVTSELASINVGSGSSFPTSGLDGNSINVHPAVIASALPRVGANAELIDLTALANSQTGPDSLGLTDEVWLGGHAPRDAVARLQAAGLDPTSVAHASTVFVALQHSGPALADDFLLFATLAALLVAAASTLGALGATTRERATELTSLRVAGVPRRSLIASLGLETAVLVLTALSGVAAGVVAALMAIPSLPELASATLTPLHYRLPVGLIAVVAVAVVALVVLAAAAVSVVLVRRMSPSLLRTAPDDVAG